MADYTLYTILAALFVFKLSCAVPQPYSNTTTTQGAIKAIEAACEASLIWQDCDTLQQPLQGCTPTYSYTTTCHVGVHPQPTLAETTISYTETLSSLGQAPQTSTVTTEADMSVSIPPAPTASGDTSDPFVVTITPKLRDDLVIVANNFCPASKKPRDDDQSPSLSQGRTFDKRQTSGASCSLPESLRSQVVPELADVISVKIPSVSELMSLGLTVAEWQTVMPQVFAAAVFTALTGAGVLLLDTSIDGRLVADVRSSVLAPAATSSTETGNPAPTMYPAWNDLRGVNAPPSIADAVASALSSAYSLTVPLSTFSCQNIAQPQVYTGAADYCSCNDGSTYPVTSTTIPTTISGTATSYFDPCPYTAPPASTTNLGPTIVATLLSSTKPAVSGITCLAGTSYRLNDVNSAITKFCDDASKSKWTATTSPTSAATSLNALQNGNSQNRYPILMNSGSISNLYLGVTFKPEACAVGQDNVSFFNKSGKSWCQNDFGFLLNNCQLVSSDPGPNPFFKSGGILNQDCIEWKIGSSS